MPSPEQGVSLVEGLRYYADKAYHTGEWKAFLTQAADLIEQEQTLATENGRLAQVHYDRAEAERQHREALEGALREIDALSLIGVRQRARAKQIIRHALSGDQQSAAVEAGRPLRFLIAELRGVEDVVAAQDGPTAEVNRSGLLSILREIREAMERLDR